MSLKRWLLLGVAGCGMFGAVQFAWSQTLGPSDLNDGRMWNDMKPMFKLTYLMGYADGMVFVLVNTARSADDKLYDRFYPKATSSFQVIDALDAFYSRPDNLRIPLPEAIQLAAARAAGVAPAEIEKRTELLRRATRPSPPQ
jgi:hypothetical protein